MSYAKTLLDRLRDSDEGTFLNLFEQLLSEGSHLSSLPLSDFELGVTLPAQRLRIPAEKLQKLFANRVSAGLSHAAGNTQAVVENLSGVILAYTAGLRGAGMAPAEIARQVYTDGGDKLVAALSGGARPELATYDSLEAMLPAVPEPVQEKAAAEMNRHSSKILENLDFFGFSSRSLKQFVAAAHWLTARNAWPAPTLDGIIIKCIADIHNLNAEFKAIDLLEHVPWQDKQDDVYGGLVAAMARPKPDPDHDTGTRASNAMLITKGLNRYVAVPSNVMWLLARETDLMYGRNPGLAEEDRLMLKSALTDLRVSATVPDAAKARAHLSGVIEAVALSRGPLNLLAASWQPRLKREVSNEFYPVIGNLCALYRANFGMLPEETQRGLREMLQHGDGWARTIAADRIRRTMSDDMLSTPWRELEGQAGVVTTHERILGPRPGQDLTFELQSAVEQARFQLNNPGLAFYIAHLLIAHSNEYPNQLASTFSASQRQVVQELFDQLTVTMTRQNKLARRGAEYRNSENLLVQKVNAVVDQARALLGTSRRDGGARQPAEAYQQPRAGKPSLTVHLMDRAAALRVTSYLATANTNPRPSLNGTEMRITADVYTAHHRSRPFEGTIKAVDIEGQPGQSWLSKWQFSLHYEGQAVRLSDRRGGPLSAAQRAAIEALVIRK